MKQGFEPVFSLTAHEALLAARKRSRAEIMHAVLELAANPFRTSDLSDRDDTDRTLSVLVLRDHVLTYWADHAARELRIVKLERIGD